MAPDKLNFIIIISDTLRRDFLSCYNDGKADPIIGRPVDTRHIQMFADKSLVFDNAYSASFPTVPHRRDVFTGCYTCTYTGWAPMTNYEMTIQKFLGGRDYTSMLIADQPHILENGFRYDMDFDGFEWIRGQEGDRWRTSPKEVTWRCAPERTRNPERQVKCHMRWREKWQGEKDSFPARTATRTMEWLEDNYDEGTFYLYVDFFDPHEPWDPPRWFIDMYDPGYEGEEIQYPRYNKVAGYMTDAEVKHSRACYAGEVTLLDRWVGRIFTKIEDLGLLDNTMVIFTTDHGFLLGEHGFIGKSLISYTGPAKLKYLPLFEEINHIPLIVYHPDTKPGRRKAIVQPPDFFPTIADMTGQQFMLGHGESFKNVILEGTAEADHHRDFAISFPFLNGMGIPVSFIKDGWASILFSAASGGESSPVDKAVDGYEKIQEPWEHAKDMLFNLKNDPQQQTDVSGEHPDIMIQFRKEMTQALLDLDTEEDWVNRWVQDQP